MKISTLTARALIDRWVLKMLQGRMEPYDSGWKIWEPAAWHVRESSELKVEMTLMSDRLATVFNCLLVAAIFFVAAFTIYQMPSGGQAAIHWGPDNRPDSWIGGSAIQLINPLVALTIWFVASFFHQGFATKRQLGGTARTRLTNLLLIQLVIQLLMALYL